MTDEPTFADWEKLAAKEVKGKDLTWQTPEGIAGFGQSSMHSVTPDIFYCFPCEACVSIRLQCCGAIGAAGSAFMTAIMATAAATLWPGSKSCCRKKVSGMQMEKSGCIPFPACWAMPSSR